MPKLPSWVPSLPGSRPSVPVWRNWAGNQRATPRCVHHPATEDELIGIVKLAASEGARVKVVGSGHSFTGIAITDGHLCELDRYADVLEVDTERRRVTVQAGIPLTALNQRLDERGFAMPNLGDIAYQTIAGATATSTHGTGVRLPGLAAQVVGLRLVTGDGSVVTCSETENADLLQAGRVGLGALGVVSTVTLQVVPAFALRAVEEPLRVDDVLANLDEHVDGNDHFEFFWVPNTGWALTKSNNRTDLPMAARSALAYWRDKVLMENVAFGAIVKAGKVRPQAIPRLAKALPSTGRVEYVEPSYRVFASPRMVKFTEMEYAIPRAACAEALNRVRAFVKEAGLQLSFPVEVRFTAPDDIPLSTASGRESCYIAVHMTAGLDDRRYFEGVERIMDDYEGRPHWGKCHYQSAATLATRYPQWDAFQAARRRLDPEGRFTNPYLDRVLGPIG